MSASPSSTRGPAASGSIPAAGPRSNSRGSPSPSGIRSGTVGSATRQAGGRTATRATGSRALRTPQSSEQRGLPEQMDTESLPELPEYANVQEAEILRLTAQAHENEVTFEEARKESISLRQDLEDARLEQHRLEDQLELRQEEIEQLNAQIRESQKSKLDAEKLAESEQQRLLEENQVIVRSNSELSAQLKTLRTSLQIERSRDPSPSPNPKDERENDPEYDSLAAALRQKDKQIDSLRLELAELEIRLAEESNSALSRARRVEEALIQAKLENIRLAEDVDSYQILLQDRTLKGEYSIMNLEGVPETDEALSSRSASPLHDDHKSGGASLAKELEEAEAGTEAPRTRALQAEIRHLKESNKALGLYINEIIGRLLQTQGFEKVLEKDVNKTLPPPPLHERRLPPSRVSHETTPRRSFAIDNSTATHKRLSSEAGISGGFSRAFSFRRKPESSNPIPNLRPLKLVEEQQPQAALRSDGTIPHTRSRTHNDENEEAAETRAAKRASWVPGWFAKAGVPGADEK